MRIFLAIICCCFVVNSHAQTFDWWARNVHWDGVSPWQRYIIRLPGFLGPNALPVPAITNGSIDSSTSLAITGNLHFSKGDNTKNLVIYGNYCLIKKIISFDASWVPYEHFTMSNVIKEKRHVFSDFYYNRHSSGEIHLNTTIQLLNRYRKNIQLALRVGYRYPSGSGLGSARDTDAPGYYFDLSFGKPFHSSGLKWIGMLGFYSWQIDNTYFRQDDAFLFGNGVEWNSKNFKLQTYVAGYLGFLGKSGDKPIVFRTSAEKKLKRIGLLLRFQQGLHDFKYTSVEFGAKYYFKNCN